MFYQERMDEALRFGDVLMGFVIASPTIKKPDAIEAYEIAIEIPSYCAVLSPCCSIGHKTISLSPLIRVRWKFFENPYFKKDLTRINREMKPEQAHSPQEWDGLPMERKQDKLKEGIGYALYDFFIYEKHDLLPKYELRGGGSETIETNYYMIDFKNIYRVSCNRINSAKDSPLDTKCLQLSIQTRKQLREKMAYYFHRPAPEDAILEI